MKTSKLFNNKFVIILSILTLSFFIYYIFKNTKLNNKYEGFTQLAPFILKSNNDIYDSYYAEIYDEIFKPEQRVNYEYKSIINMTEPSKEHSLFLDVGSGTGHLVNKLSEEGYNAYGIDKSKAMTDISLKKFPNIETKCGNVENPMIYNKNSFTHITCMDFTIYQIEDKIKFLKNCYNWLMPNGYFIVHLVDKHKYDPIVPAAKPTLLDNPQKYANQRITDSAIDFGGFKYKNTCNFKNNSVDVIITETFQDKTSSNIRQNEITLQMEEIKTLVYLIQRCGFSVKGNSKMMNDENQYIYIFEKLL